MSHQFTEPRLIAEAEIKKCEDSIFEQTGLNFKLTVSCASLDQKTPKEMLDKVANILQMSPTDYARTSRKTDYVELRYLGALFLKKYWPEMTNTQIAAMLGNFHSTTIRSGFQAATDYLNTEDERFTKKYLIVKRAIEQWLLEDIK